MHPQQWDKFREHLTPECLGRLPPAELAARASATLGYSLSAEQYAELARLDRNVIVAPDRQYGAGWTPSGFKLFVLAHPLPRVSPRALEMNACGG